MNVQNRTVRAGGLAALEARLREDLSALCHPAANWVPPTTGPDGAPVGAAETDAEPLDGAEGDRAALPPTLSPAPPSSAAARFAERGPAWIAAVALLLLAVLGLLLWARPDPDDASGPPDDGLAAVEPPASEPPASAPSAPLSPPTASEDAGRPDADAASPDAGLDVAPAALASPALGQAPPRPAPSDPDPSADRSGDPPPSRAPPPAATGEGGHLDIFARPWAEVYIDGRRHDRNAPVPNVPVSAGPHEVRLVNPVLGLSETRSVVVPPGGRERIRVLFGE